MRSKPLGILLTVFCLCATALPAPPASSSPLAQGYTAKILSASQPASVPAIKGLSKTTAMPPSGKTWFVLQIEFTPSAREATVSLKKMRLLTENGKAFRSVALAPPWKDESFNFFNTLASQPGAVGQAFTLDEGDLFMYIKKSGGQIVLQAKNPVRIKFLFEVEAGSRPQTLELDETTRVPIS